MDWLLSNTVDCDFLVLVWVFLDLSFVIGLGLFLFIILNPFLNPIYYISLH